MSSSGWPWRQLKSWPIAVDWLPEEPKKRIGPVGYHKVVGAVQALIQDETMATPLAGLRDYAFQQGSVTNANGRDRVFFNDVLTHDMVFFRGEKQALIEDLPLDPKVYDALPQMEASHFDLFQITHKGLTGNFKAQSRLLGEEVSAGARMRSGIRKGDTVFGRLIRIGRGLFLDEPYLRVPGLCLEGVETTIRAEFKAAQKAHPGLGWRSFLKVAAYHIYECIAGTMFETELAPLLAERDMEWAPMISTWKARHRRDLPELRELENARVVEEEGGKARLVTIGLKGGGGLHRTLREATVCTEGTELTMFSFLSTAQGLREHLAGVMAEKKAVVTHETLGPNSAYRALRHTTGSS